MHTKKYLHLFEDIFCNHIRPLNCCNRYLMQGPISPIRTLNCLVTHFSVFKRPLFNPFKSLEPKIHTSVPPLRPGSSTKIGAGLLSLGGILKNSKSFLLLWDSTYDQRLWCLEKFRHRIFSDVLHFVFDSFHVFFVCFGSVWIFEVVLILC